MHQERLTLSDVEALCLEVLTRNRVSAPQAEAIAATIVAAERDECRSHGLYRLIGYARSARGGKVDGHAQPVLSSAAASVLRVDAGRGFAPLANRVGRAALAEAAQANGIATLSITDCYHFSALWADIEPLVEQGLVCFAFTTGQCWVAPSGGTRPLLGTNPMAFGWPRAGGPSFLFDFATSAVARGEIELRRRAGAPIPEGWALGPDGRPTTDPEAALKGAMLPFGGHKGFALSMMVELLAGPLLGDLTSREAAARDDGEGGPPLGGELLIALDPAHFMPGDAAGHAARAEALFAEAKRQDGVRLPSERRYEARARTESAGGVEVSSALLAELRLLAGAAE